MRHDGWRMTILSVALSWACSGCEIDEWSDRAMPPQVSSQVLRNPDIDARGRRARAARSGGALGECDCGEVADL